MAWLETCRIDANKQIKHLKETQGMSVRQAIKKLAEESGIPENTINNWIYERAASKKIDAFHFMVDTIHDEWATENMIVKEKLNKLWTRGNTDYVVRWLVLWLGLEEEYVFNWYRESGLHDRVDDGMERIEGRMLLVLCCFMSDVSMLFYYTTAML